MRYNSFEELNAMHINRNRMTFDEEFPYVEDCFDTYEGLGFCDTFLTPWDENRDRNGEKFTVVRRLKMEEADLCVLPMWKIEFTDGCQIDAYPEEICTVERSNTEKLVKSWNKILEED